MNRRFSIQKQIIADVLKKLDHPTAQDILSEIKEGYPHMSMGTVYRNLNLLVEDGVIRKTSFPDSPDRFDLCTRKHSHFTCSRCGRIIDIIDDETFADIDRQIEKSTGLRVDSHSFFFQGTCPRCKEDENKK